MAGYTYKANLDKKSGEYTVDVVVTADKFNAIKEHVFSELAESVKISGFRPGKAPRAQIESQLGNKLFSETIRHLLPEVAAEIVDTESLNPVTQLEYNLEKASEDGVEFSFSFAQYPEVKLPNLDKLNLKPAKTEQVTEQEVADVMQRLLSEGKDEKQKFDISKVTDAQVAKLALDDIKTVPDLKQHITARLETIKTENAQHQFEHDVLHAVIDKSEFTIPSKLIDQQTEALMQDYLGRIQELQVNIDEFLKAQGTSQEELQSQKRAEAEHRLQHDFVLNAVAKEYNLVPTVADIDAEIAAISDGKVKAELDTPQGRRYVLSTLMQQRAMQKLLDAAGARSSAK